MSLYQENVKSAAIFLYGCLMLFMLRRHLKMTIKDILEGIVSVTVIGGGLMAFLSYILSNKFATKNDLKEHEEKCQSEICKKIDTLSGDRKSVV